MLENPDKGVTTDMYKAFVLASSLGIIEADTESRWDEAITRSEAINMLVDTYEALTAQNGYITNAMDGLADGEALDREGVESIGEGSTVNLPSGMEDIESGTDVEVDGETVGETALTQEEIDALRASTSDSAFQKGLDAYESIMETGSWTGSGGGGF